MDHHHFITDMQTSLLSNIDPNIGIFSSFPELSPQDLVENSNLNIHSLMGFSPDNLFTTQLPECPGNLSEFFPDFFPSTVISPASEPFNNSASNDHIYNLQNNTPESSSANYSSPPVSENGTRRRNSSGRGKKVKCNRKKEEEEEKPKDVVHVRARRGQATDSHSLAERVRREKVNERLKCLQDIVPGCHKTMGMAVMLDEIINYVQSLQNQVEFLSMKLTAASSFYNFNAETDTMDIMQREKAYEAMKMHKLLREGCDGIASTQLGSIDLTFGCFP